MPTTSNFGWTTPADTDLVKDGALAIRTLGNGIDTSLVDLKGGTTGQILSKASNTDLDYTWINNDQGDITAVTAGTGISGGGTSGAVTITNDMATTIDAKGDLIAGTGADAYSRLAVGTNGQVLTADSTTATGLKWASASSTPTFVGCYLQKSAAQSISNNTVTAVTWDVETLDSDAFHDNSTNNSRITIPTGKGGKYEVGFNITIGGNATGVRQVLLGKNGTDFSWTPSGPNGNASSNTQITRSTVVSLAAGDYITLSVYQNSGGSLNVGSNATDTDVSSFYAYFIGA